MTVSISHIIPIPVDAPHYELPLSRETVERIVAVAMATPGYQGNSGLGDKQFGSYAYDVTATILAAAAKTLSLGDAVALAPYVWHLRRTNFSAMVQTNDNRTWAGIGPQLQVASEILDAPSANWCSSNVHAVMDELGLPFDASEGATFRADELRNRCRSALGAGGGHRIQTVLAIATYALAHSGADAEVTVA